MGFREQLSRFACCSRRLLSPRPPALSPPPPRLAAAARVSRRSPAKTAAGATPARQWHEPSRLVAPPMLRRISRSYSARACPSMMAKSSNSCFQRESVLVETRSSSPAAESESPSVRTCSAMSRASSVVSRVGARLWAKAASPLRQPHLQERAVAPRRPWSLVRCSYTTHCIMKSDNSYLGARKRVLSTATNPVHSATRHNLAPKVRLHMAAKFELLQSLDPQVFCWFKSPTYLPRLHHLSSSVSLLRPWRWVCGE